MCRLLNYFSPILLISALKKYLNIQIHRRFSKSVTCFKKILLMCHFPVLRVWQAD